MDLKPQGNKRKAMVKASKLPFNRGQAQRFLAKEEMLERIKQMKQKKEEAK